jgi:hypothetical protein
MTTRRKRRLHVTESPALHNWPVGANFVQVVWEDHEYGWWRREDNGDLSIGNYAEAWNSVKKEYYQKPYLIKVIKNEYYLQAWEELYDDEVDPPVVEEPVDVAATGENASVEDKASNLSDADQPALFDLPVASNPSDAVESVYRKSLPVPPALLEKSSFLDQGTVKIKMHPSPPELEEIPHPGYRHTEPVLAKQPLARLDDTILDLKVDFKTLPQSSFDPSDERLTQIVADYSLSASEIEEV